MAQLADVELDTILHWCAWASDYPPAPDKMGLPEGTLSEVPKWLRGAYPELFASKQLRERLRYYDMLRELAIYAYNPDLGARDGALGRISHLLTGHNHLDELVW